MAAPPSEREHFTWVNRRQVLAALRSLPPDLQRELGRASNVIAGDLVSDARARASTPQQRIASLFMRWESRSGEPVIRAGGAADASVSGGATAGQLYFGAEFGSYGWRFPNAFRGPLGWMLYPAVRAGEGAHLARYLDALEGALDIAAARA